MAGLSTPVKAVVLAWHCAQSPVPGWAGSATLKALQLSQARYRLGADSYLPVLDAQRALYSAQQTLIGLALAEPANRITLYKVLGGRWIDTNPGGNKTTPGT